MIRIARPLSAGYGRPEATGWRMLRVQDVCERLPPECQRGEMFQRFSLYRDPVSKLNRAVLSKRAVQLDREVLSSLPLRYT